MIKYTHYLETGCGNPGVPYLNANRRFKHGTTLKFSCAEEYEMKGNENATCQEDGKWTSTMPDCLREITNFNSF